MARFSDSEVARAFAAVLAPVVEDALLRAGAGAEDETTRSGVKRPHEHGE